MESYQACETGSCNHFDQYSLTLSWILYHYILLPFHASCFICTSITKRRCSFSLSTFRLINLGFMLSAHSMEEAEALCDRLGIFVNGTMQCLGNPKEVHCFTDMLYQNDTDNEFAYKLLFY